MQEEGRTLQEITAELESRVNEIIQSRPALEPPKKGLMSWTQKKLSYTDTALQAVKMLCAQIPVVVENYSNSNNKLTFAITNAFTLASLKSNLDALDPQTWAPKVVDDDSKKLAIAVGNFAKALQLNNDTALNFLERSKPEQLEYELVKSLPKKPAPTTIYIKKADKEQGMIEYCYVKESNSKEIVTGKIPEERLVGHKSEYLNKEYFDSNKKESQNKKKEPHSIAQILHTDTGYYIHSYQTDALKILDTMRTSIRDSIIEYDKSTQSTMLGIGKK